MKKSLDLLVKINLGDDNEAELTYALLNQLSIDMQEMDSIQAGVGELISHLKLSELNIDAQIQKLDLLSNKHADEDNKHAFNVLKVILKGVIEQKAQ